MQNLIIGISCLAVGIYGLRGSIKDYKNGYRSRFGTDIESFGASLIGIGLGIYFILGGLGIIKV